MINSNQIQLLGDYCRAAFGHSFSIKVLGKEEGIYHMRLTMPDGISFQSFDESWNELKETIAKTAFNFYFNNSAVVTPADPRVKVSSNEASSVLAINDTVEAS